MSESSTLGLYDAMSTLRAVRRLRPEPVPDDVLHRVLEAATWAPSGGNLQPWRIVVVKDRETKRPLRELYREEWAKFARDYERRLEGMDEGEQAKQRRILKAGDTLAENFHLTPVLLVFCFHPGLLAITDADLDRPSVVGGGSIYPAVQNCLLACRAEGLGCTLTTLLCLREPEVKQILGIPAEWGTCAVVPIGYPVGGGHGPIRRRPVSKMAYLDRWGEALET
jgi:nitroreductase